MSQQGDKHLVFMPVREPQTVLVNHTWPPVKKDVRCSPPLVSHTSLKMSGLLWLLRKHAVLPALEHKASSQHRNGSNEKQLNIIRGSGGKQEVPPNPQNN